jgi:hypothetical protein
MKKLYISLLIVLSFLLFSSLNVTAQKNFIDGYIITLKKDTLKGQVDYREWNLNPSSIHFTDAKGKKSIFSPNDIAGFFIPPRDRYISSHVSLDITSFQTKDLMNYQAQKSIKDTALFLMTLVKGKASLYYFKDLNNREHFYVSKEGNSPVELLLKKNYTRASEGSTQDRQYITTVELFKGQLIILFSDCPDLREKIDRSEYSTSSLRSIVVGYNQSLHSPSEFVKKEEPIKIKFGLLVGPTLTKVSFSGGSDDNIDIDVGPVDLKGVKMTDCYSFLAGVSLHIIFPRERAKWSLVNELIYKPYSNSANTLTYSRAFDWSLEKYERTFNFKMEYLKLYTMLRYQYPKWKISPFADLGISNGYAIRSVNSETTVFQDLEWGKTSTTTQEAIPSPKLYEFGIVCGIGASVWKISGELRYEWAQGMSPYLGMGGPENTFFFVLSYVF